MRKLLIFSIVIVLLIGIVSASALSALWKQGISAANPQAAQVINAADRIMEIQSLAQCVTGIGASTCIQSIIEQKAMGQVYGEAIKVAGPEVQKIISTYQQLDLYREAGAELVDLKIDEEGQIQEGTIQFSGEKDSEIGNLIGKDLKKGDVSVKGVEYEAFETYTRLTFKKENAKVCVKENCFENIVPQGKAKVPTFIEFDETGEITDALFKVNEKGGDYVFGNTKINAPPNSKVFFKKDALAFNKGIDEGSLVKKGEIVIDIPDGSKIEIPTAKDDSSLAEYTTIIRTNLKSNLDDGEAILSNGARFKGTLFFEDGQARLYPGIFENNYVEIDGVRLIHSGYAQGFNRDEPLDIFFDGQIHEGNYVSLGQDKLILSSDVLYPMIELKKGNNFIPLQYEYSIGPTISYFPGSTIEIQNRDVEGLIPSIKTKGDVELEINHIGSFAVVRDNNFAVLTNSVYKMLDKYTIPPVASSKDVTNQFLEFEPLDNTGRPLIEGKVLMGKENRWAIVGESVQNKEPRITYNYYLGIG